MFLAYGRKPGANPFVRQGQTQKTHTQKKPHCTTMPAEITHCKENKMKSFKAIRRGETCKCHGLYCTEQLPLLYRKCKMLQGKLDLNRIVMPANSQWTCCSISPLIQAKSAACTSSVSSVYTRFNHEHLLRNGSYHNLLQQLYSKK